MEHRKVARWSVAAAFVVCLGDRRNVHVRASRPFWPHACGDSRECRRLRFMWFPIPATRPLASGEQLQKGEHVRTAKDSNAVLRLADGSTVEMRERSEFSV